MAAPELVPTHCERTVNALPLRVDPLSSVPDNLSEFIDEIGNGLAELYGPDAAAHYRLVAPQALRASLPHPSVRAVAVGPGLPSNSEPARYTGLAVAITKAQVSQITLVHVLRGCDGKDQSSALITGMVELLRGEGVEGIICEAVPMVPLDLKEPFRALGFTRIERFLMMADLMKDGIARPSLRESRPLAREDLPGLATVIVEAYRDHPGRRLHAEVRDRDGATAFLEGAMSGGFGTTRAAFTRVIARDGRIVAGIVGCEIAPGIGFVLQVAVTPAHQNRGLGTVLVRELSQSFHEAGFRRMALGVTVDNPARRLYERLGFGKHRAVDAFVWWRSSP